MKGGELSVSKQAIQALTYELEDTRLDIKKAIKMSDDKTAVHHLHGTVKRIEEMLDAVYIIHGERG